MDSYEVLVKAVNAHGKEVKIIRGAFPSYADARLFADAYRACYKTSVEIREVEEIEAFKDYEQGEPVD